MGNKYVSIFLVSIACFWNFWITHFVIGTNYPYSGDYISHIAKEIVISENIKLGRGIFTLFPQDLGIPLLYMYHPLFHLLVVGIYFLFFCKISIIFIHNLIAVLLFSLYPLSIYYCLRKFNFPYLLCGIGALFSITPISGWGNTFDSVFRIGVTPQVLASFVFPIFVGKFYEFVHNKNKPFLLIPILVSSIILSHAMFAFYISHIFWIFVILILIYFKFKKIVKSGWKIFLITIFSFLLMIFWINSYRFYHRLMPYHHWFPNAQFHSFTMRDFVRVFISGELLDTVGKESMLFERKRGLTFRWPFNKDLNRPKILTYFSLLGFLITLIRIKEFKYSFLAIGWITAMLRLLGNDDIRLFIGRGIALRYIVLFEFFSIILASIGLFNVIKITIYIFKKNKNLRYFNPIILVVIIFFTFFPLYRERYVTAKRRIKFLSKHKVNEFWNALTPCKDEKEFGKRLWIEEVNNKLLRMGFILSNTPLIYQDYFYGMFRPLTLLMYNSKKVIHNKNLQDLLNMHYLLYNVELLVKNNSSDNFFFKLVNKYEFFPIHYTTNYVLFEKRRSLGYFKFLKYKPILVLSNNRHWWDLNQSWLNNYAENKIPDIFFIRSLTTCVDDLKISVDDYPAIFLIDYEIKNEQKAYKVLKNYISQGGILIGFRSIFNLPIEVITLPNNNLSRIINTIYKKQKKFLIAPNGRIKEKEIKYNYYNAKISAYGKAILLFKMNYFPNWKVLVDGKKTPYYQISPMFLAIYIPKGTHTIEIEWGDLWWQKVTKLISLLTLVGFILGVIVVRKKNKREKGEIIYNPWAWKLSLLIIIILLSYIGYLYIQQAIIKIPVVVEPYNSIRNPAHVRFFWNKYRAENVSYDFQLAEDYKFNKIIKDMKDIKRNYLRIKNLRQNKNYYWRVRVKLKNKPYRWTKPIKFKTEYFCL